MPAVAGWFAWPANLVLTYILDNVHVLSGIPGIFLHRSISTPAMLYFYSFVLLILAGLQKQHLGRKKAIITNAQNLEVP